MKSKFYKILLSTFFGISLLSSSLQSEIIESNEIQTVKQYLEDETLVLFNIGDTLFSPSSTLAHNLWRVYFVERVNFLIKDEKIAQPIIDHVKGIIVEKIPKVLSEETTAELIVELQNQKIPVLGYSMRQYATTYAKNNGQIVSNHLKGLGINLEATLSYFQEPENLNPDYNFDYGIIFTNKHPVNSAIDDFLQKLPNLPKKVIVVSDSVGTLESTETALKETRTQFLGMRYGRIDERQNTFNPDLGTIQFFAYMNENKLMTDEEASEIRESTFKVNYESLLDQWILNKAQ